MSNKDNPNYNIDCDTTNEELINKFIKEKELMSCSDRKTSFYTSTFTILNEWTIKPLKELTTQDIRDYFKFHQDLHNCSNSIIDNVCHIFSSFCTYIFRRIFFRQSYEKIPATKQNKSVKQSFTTEKIILMRYAIIYDKK